MGRITIVLLINWSSCNTEITLIKAGLWLFFLYPLMFSGSLFSQSHVFPFNYVRTCFEELVLNHIFQNNGIA